MAKNMTAHCKALQSAGHFSGRYGYTARRPPSAIRATVCAESRSEYATQLKEKQKLKFIYGVLEHQFASYL